MRKADQVSANGAHASSSGAQLDDGLQLTPLIGWRSVVGSEASWAKAILKTSPQFDLNTAVLLGKHLYCAQLRLWSEQFYVKPFELLELKKPLENLYKDSGSRESMSQWVMNVPKPGELATCIFKHKDTPQR